MKPGVTANESLRLRGLRQCRILDTPPEQPYDDIASLAATVCATPIAAISFVDRSRQWVKSSVGIQIRETPRSAAFCAHAILDGDRPFIVTDARADKRFRDNPLVTGPEAIRFYTGIPIRLRGELSIGTLCVLDRVPRELDAPQIGGLQALARQLVALLETREVVRATGSGGQVGSAIQSVGSPIHCLDRHLESLRLGVFTATGPLGRIATANEALAVMLEAPTPEALQVVKLRDLFVEPKEYDNLVGSRLHENSTILRHVHLKTLGHRHLHALLTATPERQHRRVVLSGVLQDVTEHREAERDRENFFQLALDMLCVAGNDGYFKVVNPAFEHILGYSTEELLARPYIEYVHPDDVAKTLQEAIRLSRGENTVSFVNRYLCKDGNYKHISWVATASPEEGRVYAIARDITSQKQAEQNQRALDATRVEIALARLIQQRLLQEHPPKVPGYDISGFVQQTETVGGDYYDFIPGRHGKLFLVVGDVSGHGVAPSVIMAMVRTCLWSVLPRRTRLDGVMEQLNTLLAASIPSGLFVTLSLLELDTATGRIRSANCAHPSTQVLGPAGELIARLESSGLPLGCFPDTGVRISEGVVLPVGGTLVMVTDGMLEAESPWHEMFGEERLIDVVRVHHHRSADETVHALQSALRAFCSSDIQLDDVTALIVRRTA